MKRQTYDKALKDSVAQAILGHTKTVDQVCKEHEIQPYQVYAWVGERALKPSAEGEETQRHHIPAALRDAMAAGVPPNGTSSQPAKIDPELARMVGEWWLTVRLPQRLKEGK